LGPVERSVRLGGFLSMPGHAKLVAELCLGPGGAWVVAAEDRFVGVMFDATSADSLRYERGRLRDRLLVNGVSLAIPAAKAADARRSIALGRLRRSAGATRALPLAEDRYIARLGEPALALAAALIRGGDLLVAVREVGQALPIRSELGPTVDQRQYLLVSAERVFLFALSELGDSRVEELEAGRLELETRDGKALLVIGSGNRPLEPRQAGVLAELVELCAMPPAERLFEAARRLHLIPEGDGRARSRRLLEAAGARGQPLAHLAGVVLSLAENQHERFADSTLERAASGAASVSEAALNDFCARWDFEAAALGRAVRELSRLGERGEPAALWLHRALRSKLPDDQTLDAELAEHELESGDFDRARRLAESRLDRLPLDEDAVLAPGKASEAHLLRVRLHDLIARTSVQSGRGESSSFAALARLEPLSRPRLEALASAASDGDLDERLAQRARDVLECLSAGGLKHPPPPGESELPRPLERVVLEERVAHPLSRGSGRLAARLSELVAVVPEPELGFLRDFCEELGETRHPDAARALARATRLLGLPAVRAYVSHGARSLGLRAFGAHEAFVLIGANHLEEHSPHRLAGPELDFAFAAELSHLAFGHQRVTVSEVWIGAAGKTRDALLALGLVLPVIAEIGGGRAFKLLKRVSPETVARGAEAADRLEKLVGGRKNSLSRALGQHNEELIGAHRLVQLSADRAGLVLAPHLPSALRTILLTRADYRELFLLAHEIGLSQALERRPLAEAPMADLLVRIRSLVAFYLSADFDSIVSNTAFTAPPSRSFSILP
jgi:hypothetical protein